MCKKTWGTKSQKMPHVPTRLVFFGSLCRKTSMPIKLVGVFVFFLFWGVRGVRTGEMPILFFRARKNQ